MAPEIHKREPDHYSESMYRCIHCREERSQPRTGERDPWTCSCGGRLQIRDPSCTPGIFPWVKLGSPSTSGRSAFPLLEGLAPGGTPFLKEEHFWVKAEYRNPTGSFKDRGAAIVVTAAKHAGAKTVVADSSGNAALALAALAGRERLSCELYVPASCPSERTRRLQAHGADVSLVEGPRSAVADACLERLVDGDAWDAGHARNPWFLQGTRSFLFELFEQSQRELPSALVFPAGNGTLLLGSWLALCELREEGTLAKIPRLYAAQVDGCAPLQEIADPTTRRDPSRIGAIGNGARGLMVDRPPLGAQVIDAIRESGGAVLSVSEAAMSSAATALAVAGHPPDSCNAVVWAAALDICKEGSGGVVAALTGSGNGAIPEGERPLQDGLEK